MRYTLTPVETVFYGLWLVISIIAVVDLLLNKREPSSTLSWLLFVIFVPYVGTVLFYLIGPQRLERKAILRKRTLDAFLENVGSRDWKEQSISAVAENDREVLDFARRISEYSATSSNTVEMLLDPHDALMAMKAEIEKATKFVHLEYYIIQSDEVTKLLFEAMLSAARRGVEVRILYDSLGSLWLKRIFLRKLVKEGAKVAGFLPLSFLPQRLYVNFRNHRKILVVDGKVAFTGGSNIGREYLGRRFDTQWHDYAVKVMGPACSQLEDVFAKDWHFTTQEDLFHDKYYPGTSPSGDSVIQVVESGPDSTFLALHQAIFLALNSAEKEILMITPYFIPDPAIMSSLCVAALRGISVKLLLPAKTDLKLVQYASRSFYDTLLKAGVQIHEFQPRILHAKLLCIDGKWTIVGSANMDIRSFQLNFELNLFIYGKSVAHQAKSTFERDLAQSRKIELEEFLNRSVGKRILENACRLLSPVL